MSASIYKMINKDVPSMRRTMSSADLSSPKGLQYNAFFSSSSMKRAQSSEQLHDLVEDHSENQIDYCINQEKKRSWNSILSQDQNNSGFGFGSGSGSGEVLPPPYVHPSVRRSVSSLSEKSLEICTESLGSETGSDRFSYPASDKEDSDSDTDTDTDTDRIIKKNNDEFQVSLAKYYPPTNKRVPPSPRSFPPPLPSLRAHRDGSNLHIMRSHRQDGKLVLEVVSVPSNNCFRAHRHGGRLLLTLANDSNYEDEHEHAQEEIDNEEKQVLHPPSSPALIMSKRIIGITNLKTNSRWRRHNLDAPGVGVGPMMSTTTAANAYQYYWRRTTAVAHVLNPLAGQTKTTNHVGSAPQVEKRRNINKSGLGGEIQQEEVVVVKAARVVGVREKEIEYLVPFLRGCKEHRKSLLCWEPYCIATS